MSDEEPWRITMPDAAVTDYQSIRHNISSNDDDRDADSQATIPMHACLRENICQECQGPVCRGCLARCITCQKELCERCATLNNWECIDQEPRIWSCQYCAEPQRCVTCNHVLQAYEIIYCSCTGCQGTRCQRCVVACSYCHMFCCTSHATRQSDVVVACQKCLVTDVTKRNAPYIRPQIDWANRPPPDPTTCAWMYSSGPAVPVAGTSVELPSMLIAACREQHADISSGIDDDN